MKKAIISCLLLLSGISLFAQTKAPKVVLYGTFFTQAATMLPAQWRQNEFTINSVKNYLIGAGEIEFHYKWQLFGSLSVLNVISTSPSPGNYFKHLNYNDLGFSVDEKQTFPVVLQMGLGYKFLCTPHYFSEVGLSYGLMSDKVFLFNGNFTSKKYDVRYESYQFQAMDNVYRTEFNEKIGSSIYSVYIGQNIVKGRFCFYGRSGLMVFSGGKVSYTTRSQSLLRPYSSSGVYTIAPQVFINANIGLKVRIFPF
ncbi:hypothetical protein GC194_05605 [bacterium]|nr:hypothetical protein [bacterium]